MINFRKLVEILLPSSLRVERLRALILVLISPIVEMYCSISIYMSEKRLLASCTPSAAWIEKMIYYHTGYVALIQYPVGSSYDFVVSVSQLDLNDTDAIKQIGAVVNKYKQAGRSWTFTADNIAYTCAWDVPVCVKLNIESAWNTSVCTRREQVDIRITVLTGGNQRIGITAYADKAHSDIHILGLLYRSGKALAWSIDVPATHSSGETTVMYTGSGNYDVQIVDIAPEDDGINYYIIDDVEYLDPTHDYN